MQFRYHPILPDLKINEDGTEILSNGVSMKIKIQKLPHARKVRRVIFLGAKTINTIRLVCEAWHGVAPTGEHAARRIDEDKGDHYSNLTWGKKGMTLSTVKGHKWNTRSTELTAKEFRVIQKRNKKETLASILFELKISNSKYYKFKKKHDEKN